MNLRMKYKTLKRENENLKKQMEIMDQLISSNLDDKEKMESQIAAQRIILSELESENKSYENRIYKLQKNTDRLYNTIYDKVRDISILNMEKANLKAQLEKRKSIFKRLFA